MRYRVYVIGNEAERYYIGLSEDPQRRLLDHNHGRSRWTRGRGPWRILWLSGLLTLSEARKLELTLKRQGRGNGFYQLTGLQRPSMP